MNGRLWNTIIICDAVLQLLICFAELQTFSPSSCVVPSAGDYAGFPGCGLLRLHSTYRHDLKIYASDEGRVQMTAAAFAKVTSTILQEAERTRCFLVLLLVLIILQRGVLGCCWCQGLWFWLQGLLALEGELTPILVQMVKSANMNGLLDSDSDSLTDCQQKVKARLHEIMQKDLDFTQDDYQKVGVRQKARTRALSPSLMMFPSHPSWLLPAARPW